MAEGAANFSAGRKSGFPARFEAVSEMGMAGTQHKNEISSAERLLAEVARLRDENRRLTKQIKQDRRAIEELASARESDQQKATILESISDGFFSLDRDWRVTFINTQGEKLLGKTRAEVVGRVLWDVFPEARDSRFQNEYEKAAKEQSAVHFEEYYPPHAAWYGVHAYPTPVGLSVYFTNVTERRRSEEELKRHNRRLGLLAWTSNQLLLSAHPERALPQLCTEALSELDCEVFLIHLNGTPDKRLELNSYGGVSEETAEAIRALHFGLDSPAEGLSAYERHLQTAEELRGKLYATAQLSACACNPLIYDERLIGVLSFGSRRREAFRPWEIALMASFSNQVAIAMGRRLAEEELRRMHVRQKRRSEQLEILVQARTTELARANSKLRRRNRVLRALAKELTETEQRERQRFSELLHDNLQQLLVAARLRTSSACAGGLSPAALEDVSQADELLQQSITVSRSLAYELTPPVLYHAGLGAGLSWLAGHMEQLHGLRVRFDAAHAGLPTIPTPLGVFLFGVVRELLLNVVKHAGVNDAVVEAGRDGADLWIRVSDQGKGFDPQAVLSAPERPPGLGLFSIRERLHLFRGRLDVESEPAQGARVTLRVPLG
jgi:PAS domain S-box-containing protein